MFDWFKKEEKIIVADAVKVEREVVAEVKTLINPSTVESIAAQLVKIASNYASKIKALEASAASINEELRQHNAALGATVAAITSVKDDPALSDAIKTSILALFNPTAAPAAAPQTPVAVETPII